MKTTNKYYLIYTYSPYFGEEEYHYVIADNITDAEEIAEQYTDMDASEWYDDQAEDEYGDEFWSECGYYITEVTEEEYNRHSK